VPIAIGSDSQTRIDPFEEARELETLSRRERQLRSGLLAASGGALWDELWRAGCVSLGLDSTPRLVEINLDHPDLRGIEPTDLPLALVTCASAAVVSASPS
jgi:formimidoylglutamate deiminase